MKKMMSVLLVVALIINTAFSNTLSFAEGTVVESVVTAEEEKTGTEENTVVSDSETEAAETTNQDLDTTTADDKQDEVSLLGEGTDETEKSGETVFFRKVNRGVKDVFSILKEFKKTILHKGKELVEGQEIDLNYPIEINVRFNLPVKGDHLNGVFDEDTIVIKGDRALIDLGKGIQYEGEPNIELRGQLVLEDGTTPVIGHLSLNTLTDGMLQARIDFDGDDAVFNGTLRDVWVEALLSVEVKEEIVPNGPDKEIELFGQKFTVIPNKPVESITKTGELVKVQNGDHESTVPTIKWMVEVEVKKPGGGLLDLHGYRLRDVIDKYVAKPMRYKKIYGFTLNNQDISSSYDEATKTLTYEFPERTLGKQTFVYYTDLYAEDYFVTTTGHRANIAYLEKKAPGASEFKHLKSSNKTVYIPGRTWIAKRGYVGSVQKRTAGWHVYFNYAKEPLKNVKIKDVLPEGMTYLNAWLEQYGANPKNNDKVEWHPYPNGEKVKIEPNAEGIYNIGAIDKHARLVIEVKVDDSIDINSQKSFMNRATVIMEQEPGDTAEHSAEWQIAFGVDNLTKRSTKTSWTDPKIEWEVKVPYKVKNRDLTNKKIRVFDLLVSDQDVSEQFLNNTANHARITGLPDGINIKDIVPFNLTHMKYVAGSFATQSAGVRLVGVHSVNLDDKKIADLVEVEVDTEQIPQDGESAFTLKAMPMSVEKAFLNKGYSTWMNNTAFSYDGIKQLNREYNSVIYRPEVLEKKMLTVEGAREIKKNQADLEAIKKVATDKAGGFDNVALEQAGEGVIVFRFDVNAGNHTELKNIMQKALLRDVLPQGWEIAPIAGKEFLVYEANSTIEDYQEGGALRQRIAAVTPISKLSDDQVTALGITHNFDNTHGRRIIHMDITNLMDKTYIILLAARPRNDKITEYKASANSTVKLENIAGLKYERSNRLTNAQETRDIYAKQEFEFNIGLVGKEAKSLTGLVEWKVTANPYNINETYDEISIVDKLGEGINMRLDSVGNVVESDYQLFSKTAYGSDDWTPVPKTQYQFTFDKTTKEIKVVLPDHSRAYQFIYNTEISEIAGKDVTNTVRILGKDKALGEVVNNYRVQTINAKVRYGINGNIEILKKDQAGLPVQDAEFTLEKIGGTSIKGTTSSLGSLIFNPIQPGTYILKETQVPAGYKGSEKATVQGYQIEVKETVVNGVLKIITKIDNEELAGNRLTVVNEKITKSDLVIRKVVTGEGANLDKEFEFTFNLSGNGVVADTEYEVSPASATANGKIRSGEKFKIKNSVSVTIKDLPIGSEYTLTEDDYTAQGYVANPRTATGSVVLNTPAVIFTNTYTGKTLTVTKKWHKESLQTRDVKVQLYSRISVHDQYIEATDEAGRITAEYTEGGQVKQVTNIGTNHKVIFVLPNTAEGGKLTIKNLPLVDKDGKKIYYSVREIVDENDNTYMAFVDCGDDDYDKILYNIETTPLKVVKEWITTVNEKKPVTFILKHIVNGEKKDFDADFANSMLSVKENGLSAAFNTPQAGQTRLSFSVYEGNNWTADLVLPKFDKNGTKIVYTVEEVTVDGFRPAIISAIETNQIKVKNISDEKTSVTVTKTWKHAPNSTTPDVKVVLLADGDPAVKDGTTQEVTLTTGMWSHTFSELPVYNGQGIKINYTIEEKTVVSGYKTTYTGQGTNQVEITNTRSGITRVKVTKDWVGKKMDSVTVELLQNGESMVPAKTVDLNAPEWAHTFRNLEEFDAEGIAYKYTVVEKNVNKALYSTKTEGNQTNGFTITNTNIEKVEILVTKKWQAPAGTALPTQLQVNLTSNAGHNQPLTLVGPSWQGTFTDLPRYDASGNEIKYTVTEEIPTGFNPNPAYSGIDVNTKHVLISDATNVTASVTGTGYVTITNTIIGEVPVSVTKKWIGAPTASITVQLHRQVTGGTLENVGDPQVITPVNNVWQHSFGNQPQYNDKGQEYTYSVTEVSPGAVYSTEIEKASDSFSFTITNTNNALINVSVTKKWHGKELDKVTVKLFADNIEQSSTLTLNKTNSWTDSFKNLRKFHAVDGHEIVYTVKEVPVEGYETAISGDVANGFIITNTEKFDIPVRKVWVHSSMPSVTVRLFLDDKEIGSKVLSAANNWNDKFTGLLKYDKVSGAELKYTLKEDVVANFKTEITGDKDNGFVVTNTYIPAIPPYNPPGGEETPTPPAPNPNPNPTPTPTPNPNPENPTDNIPEEPTPQGDPNKPNTPSPQPGIITENQEEPLDENEIPKGNTELPKTDGIPAEAMHFFGMVIAALGVLFKKKK